MKIFFVRYILIVKLLVVPAGSVYAEIQDCEVGNTAKGYWEPVGTFEPVQMNTKGPFPWWFNPLDLGMFASSQMVGYQMTIPGYGTQYIGKYALQLAYHNPSVYTDFTFFLTNGFGWAFIDDRYVNSVFFMDPIVGIFRIRAFGGTQYRGPNLYKYYCATALTVSAWKCKPQPAPPIDELKNRGGPVCPF